ncbi:hypothetical protein AB9M92_13775 [Peribacillus frigoritolerans]
MINLAKRIAKQQNLK